MTKTKRVTKTAKRPAPRRIPASNIAIMNLADARGLKPRALADLLYVSVDTVRYWRRQTKPNAAPLMALALLCYRLGLPPHPLLRGKARN